MFARFAGVPGKEYTGAFAGDGRPVGRRPPRAIIFLISSLKMSVLFDQAGSAQRAFPFDVGGEWLKVGPVNVVWGTVEQG